MDSNGITRVFDPGVVVVVPVVEEDIFKLDEDKEASVDGILVAVVTVVTVLGANARDVVNRRECLEMEVKACICCVLQADDVRKRSDWTADEKRIPKRKECRYC